MSIKTAAKALVGAVSLGAATALGFLPHTDPWFNVLTGVVAVAGTYGIFQVPNKKQTPREEAIGAAVGAVATDLASSFTGKWDPAAGATLGRATEAIAPAKTFPAAQVAAVTALPAADPPVTDAPAPTVTPVYTPPAEPAPAAETSPAPEPTPPSV